MTRLCLNPRACREVRAGRWIWAPVMVGTLLALAGITVAQEASPTPAPNQAPVAAEIATKEAELKDLAEKIRVLRAGRASKQQETSRLTDTVELLEDRVRQARLELDYTIVSLEETRLRVRAAEEDMVLLGQKQERVRQLLAKILNLMDGFDRRSPLEVLLLPGTFADVLRARQAVERLQAKATALVATTRDLRRALEARAADLKTRQADLESLEKLSSAQRVSLQEETNRARRTLTRSVAEAVRLSSLLAEAEQARQEIQAEIFSLKNAGVRLSLRQAEEYARYAEGATGVRAALLLGVLKVESNTGTNVGSGRYPDDVHPNHREAFLRVVETLGLDPRTAPVSAKPTAYAGWGGAMGPGQIMPGTWERIASEVGRLTSHARPTPYDLLDAFVGTAVLLRNSGAASGDEYEAVNRYFAGPNWQRFTWYGDRVLAVAKEYETRGL